MTGPLDLCCLVAGLLLILVNWHTFRGSLSGWPNSLTPIYRGFQLIALILACLIGAAYVSSGSVRQAGPLPSLGNDYLLLFLAVPADAFQNSITQPVKFFRPNARAAFVDLLAPVALALAGKLVISGHVVHDHVLLGTADHWHAFGLLCKCTFLNYGALSIGGVLFQKAMSNSDWKDYCILRFESFVKLCRGSVTGHGVLYSVGGLMLLVAALVPNLPIGQPGGDGSPLLLLVILVRLALQMLLRFPVFEQSKQPKIDEEEESANEVEPHAAVCCCTRAFDEIVSTKPVRSLEELSDLLNENLDSLKYMCNEELLLLLKKGKVPTYRLENMLKDDLRAVFLRRKWFADICSKTRNVDGIPFSGFDYSMVTNACCENVLGYVPIPLGFAGPLKVDDQVTYVPLCTTEGCLVASINRGCRALTQANGVRTALLSDSMTRGPVVTFENIVQAEQFKNWIEDGRNFDIMASAFDRTSRYARLKSVRVSMAGRLVFLRFSASTGDAMGMNMVSKGVQAVLQKLLNDHFPKLTVLSLSGNYCVDKKPSAVNWILGRGKSVTGEAVLPKRVVREVLKVDVDKLVELNTVKNLVGSARAGVIGGFNAHSANIVAAVFASTGQDLAQVVSSSQCVTFLEKTPQGDLCISCTMPCLEVGTIGGGTGLPAQRACLKIMGCAGGCADDPGKNARKLSRIICGAVMAGELSLLAALSCNQLVSSHLRYNRSAMNFNDQQASDAGGLGEHLQDLANRCLKQNSMHPQSCSTVFM